MMSYEDYQRIWEDYTQKETIQTPLGLMVGRPTPEGSKIPWSEYSMLLEDGPHKGEFIDITGLGGGHGTLYLNTKQYGHTEIRIEYDQPKVEYKDDDCPCECDDEEVDEPDPETEVLKLTNSTDGFRTSKAFAERAAEWFNGGHPRTMRMPVSVMRNGLVADTEMAPPNPEKKTVWRSLELSVGCTAMHDGKATVLLDYETMKHNEGQSSLIISDVTSIDYRDGKLTITGRDSDGTGHFHDASVEVEVIDKPETKAKKAPKWYLEEMELTIAELRGAKGSAVMDAIIGGSDELDWLHPANALPTPCQTAKAPRQRTLEEFA